jgi:hypothetical protein
VINLGRRPDRKLGALQKRKHLRKSRDIKVRSHQFIVEGEKSKPINDDYFLKALERFKPEPKPYCPPPSKDDKAIALEESVKMIDKREVPLFDFTRTYALKRRKQNRNPNDEKQSRSWENFESNE